MQFNFFNVLSCFCDGVMVICPEKLNRDRLLCHTSELPVQLSVLSYFDSLCNQELIQSHISPFAQPFRQSRGSLVAYTPIKF